MEHVPGLILRGDLPDGLALDPAAARDLALGMFDSLADLHSVDIAASGLDTFWRGPGYVRRQVEGWSRRYRAARTDDVPDGEDVMAWLDAHQPEDVARPDDPRRLALRQPRRSTPTTCRASGRSSTGRWPRSATR